MPDSERKPGQARVRYDPVKLQKVYGREWSKLRSRLTEPLSRRPKSRGTSPGDSDESREGATSRAKTASPLVKQTRAKEQVGMFFEVIVLVKQPTSQKTAEVDDKMKQLCGRAPANEISMQERCRAFRASGLSSSCLCYTWRDI